MALTVQEIKQVKAQGFLRNRGTDCFSGRIITENGLLSAEQLKTVSEAAEKFGNGTVTFTTRLTLELPGVPYDSIPALQEYVAKSGLVTGGTGAKVRPVAACKGTTCVFGLYDTQALGAEIHHRFFEGYADVALPHKFKIAVGGCPNNCLKPDLNDVGIVGQRKPDLDFSLCKNCKRCVTAAVCPMAALSSGEKGLELKQENCTHCGRCTGTCPFGVARPVVTLYKIYIGGRWGKSIRIGSPLSRLFTCEEALDIVEKSLLLFKRDGIQGERFAVTIDRMGLSEVERLLLSNELLSQKDEILSSAHS